MCEFELQMAELYGEMVVVDLAIRGAAVKSGGLQVTLANLVKLLMSRPLCDSQEAHR